MKTNTKTKGINRYPIKAREQMMKNKEIYDTDSKNEI